jgi:hypothetical protein
MTSTALATGAMVMHPFDAFAQPTAAQGGLLGTYLAIGAFLPKSAIYITA